MFDLTHNLAAVKPADYNPRQIDGAAFESLRDSLRSLGPVRPIIVTDEAKLIAGHQRVRAMLANGTETAPAHVLPAVDVEDEIRFNQLHNASDVELVDAELSVPRHRVGWHVIDPKSLTVARRPGMAAKLVEICRLLAKHGAWGNAVADDDGRVLAGQLYAHACRLLGVPLHLCVIPRHRSRELQDRLARRYGTFSYARMPRTTWVQSLAQLHRIRPPRECRPVTHKPTRGPRGKSRTYEEFVIPHAKRGVRVLDFGCGQGDYVRLLRRRGIDIIGVEFYRRRRGTMDVDVRAVHRDIDRLCASLRTRGRFDLVVCDSVLNSVDSLQAEADVLASINALCRPGGRIVFSGRRRAFEDAIENGLNYSRSTLKRHVYFLDDDGFSAMYQRGVWLFQRFHSDDQVRQLAASAIGPNVTSRLRGSAWAVGGPKSIELPWADAIGREFDLPLPDGSRYGRSADVASAIAAAISRESGRRAPGARAPQAVSRKRPRR
jgi:ParB family transcriptional regulator, chromosome partitioning protein